MNEWTEIRRKVLVEGVSKRSIRRDYRIGSGALEKILANSEPLGYRQTSPPETQARRVLGRHRRDLEPRQDRTAKAAPHRKADLRTLARRVRLHRVLLPGTRRGGPGQAPPKGGLRPAQPPPGHAQFDFGEAVVVIAGLERKAHSRS